MEALPFTNLTNLEIQNLYETGSDKLKRILDNSILPKYIRQLVPYFQQTIPGSNYYVEDEFNSYTNKIKPKFSVFHLNIRSLNCHRKELIAYLHVLNLKFDCICLSEVWSTNWNSYQLILKDYISFFAEPTDSNVGGVVMFVKNIYKILERKDLKIPFSSKVRVENLWVEITNKSGEKHIVSVIYRHPREDVKLFTDQIENSLSKIENDRTIKHSVITGDFNIDLIKFDLNNNINDYLNTILQNSFVPTILLPTRVTDHTCTLIDHIYYFSRNANTNVASGNLLTDMSDHFANFLILHSNIQSKENERPMVRIFSEKAKNAYQNLLSEISWDEELSNKNVNEAMQVFSKKLQIAYNKSFPLKRLSRKRAKDKPWITAGLKQSIKQKHLLYQQFIFDRTEENKVAYKIFKNKLRSVIRKAEADYYKEAFSSKSKSIKEMWKELGDLSTTKRKKGNPISKLIVNNVEITKDKDIANTLNKHFTNIGKNLAEKIVPKQNLTFKTYLTNPTANSLYLRPTDSDEILKEINRLKTKATLDIRVSLLKHVKQEIVNGLVIIFNKSFEEGRFPEMLKIAKVIPIFKGENPTDPNNYRPISLLSIFDKLLEKVMYNRVNAFLTKHKIFYKYQFGFRKNHATADALSEVIDFIYKSLDEGNFVFGIYIDLKKAFDTVQHRTLLYKLQHYGIRGLALQWFESYLSKRKQYVVTNNTQSDMLELCEYGVPQGSVLGPILFLLFINDSDKTLR